LRIHLNLSVGCNPGRRLQGLSFPTVLNFEMAGGSSGRGEYCMHFSRLERNSSQQGGFMMRRLALFTLAIGLFLPLLAAAPAQAQATRTWVSGVGDDANPCSRTAPCKTFAGAISKTAPAGEINCLDPGGFGALTITKSISILCESGTAGVLVSGTNGIVVAAATTDFVYLKGIDFEGIGTGLSAIKFITGAGLVVDSCVIRDFNSASGLGIEFVPTSNASLMVLNTVVSHNGAANGGGIKVAPVSPALAHAILNRVTIDHNTNGVADFTGGNIQINDSTITNSVQIGILNLGTGNIRVGRSVIASNAGGSISGTVLSYGDNQLNDNTPDTAPGSVTGGYK
jgi:hypothetical protein